METRTYTRVAAIAFAGLAVAVAAMGMMDGSPSEGMKIDPPPRERAIADSQRQLLRYCRDKGEFALRDPICLQLWIDNRERFFGKIKSKEKGGPLMRTAPSSDTSGDAEKAVDKSKARDLVAPATPPAPAVPVERVAPTAVPSSEEVR
ncbi:putative entry exclusion protein TrbK-alt [Bosea sp. MMO-172]|uniref:putative entry exclusion protein TrbK-alt n=1 Tax=Bosea sp. MMO-172 TaxID=3127885 RepID=UPI00301A9006